ncbi:hypothetical protein DM860_011473 [Cuscuta australis]|uniref:SWIM-type domain-containing protein n=1 Tax=Cuscuta australis TaxID=267555 RepID=A0A328DTQ3_9ASTE|nr:hypothetical protein DM860_011473 [Cuscuta australis]
MQFEIAMDAQRHRNAKLNADSESCIPVFKTPLPIERHAAAIYTLSVFYDVQKEICAACFSCFSTHVENIDDKLHYTIKDNRGMTFSVMYSADNSYASCSCKHYQRVGLLCRHIFVVLIVMGCPTIPDNYVTKRWCKIDIAKRYLGSVSCGIEGDSNQENTRWKINHLWANIHACVELAENDSELLDAFTKFIKTQKQNLERSAYSGDSDLEKNKIFEAHYGTPAPSEIRVLPPEKVHNKGSGKRIKSAVEISMEQSKKQKRVCRTCKEVGYHDSRNCPMNKGL